MSDFVISYSSKRYFKTTFTGKPCIILKPCSLDYNNCDSAKIKSSGNFSRGNTKQWLCLPVCFLYKIILFAREAGNCFWSSV